MIGLRTIHAAGVILCGAAVGLVAVDMPRAAIAALAINVVLFAWSLETMRHAIATRLSTNPENRP